MMALITCPKKPIMMIAGLMADRESFSCPRKAIMMIAQDS